MIPNDSLKHKLSYQKLVDLELLDIWAQTGGNIDYLIAEGFLNPADIEEVETETAIKEQSSSRFKVGIVFTIILALLSIGMCLQASQITQALREFARISAYQIIQTY
ncbi:hypothetical protein [Calothrix sp. UHCC 0171]|uniref:hypothetical protein n=1 Tax=Calothrix sp. UHCC 0171 TaxID=3110245 RepID=UPI002B21903F|nr:hypothetical protein [Calothrix sp. UHCC 0171]MEA5571782.1 hypothetical protein [Calothrix sp. UHCC 0171]